jgi:inorganic pyrophosphatase
MRGTAAAGSSGALPSNDSGPDAVSFAPPPARAAERITAMPLDLVPTGRDVPNEVNVIIEIPMNAEPVKYEVDKASGAIFVDRVLSTPMRYPCNYGYIPHTLSGDGDPADVLVLMPLPLIPGSVIRVRPVGMLKMTDEAGSDEKLLVVPDARIFAGYAHIADIGQVSGHWLERIGHFFEHYKDLEKGKWVRVDGWADAAAAKAEIVAAVGRYGAAKG